MMHKYKRADGAAITTDLDPSLQWPVAFSSVEEDRLNARETHVEPIGTAARIAPRLDIIETR